jgi:hypothetical protein
MGVASMAMPHMVFKRKCMNELKGLSNESRARKVDELLSQMAGYKSGPYAEVREWLHDQRSKAVTSKRILHSEPWEVKKQGDFSFALVGFPSVGKSSLIKALTGAQIKIADYDFTTIKPFSATVRFNSALIQLIDLPGIIEGASQGKGFGRRVMGNALIADRVIIVVDSAHPAQLGKIVKELSLFGFDANRENACVVFTKDDLAHALTKEFSCVSFSSLKENSIQELKRFLFTQAGLVRAYPYNSPDPVLLKADATVGDFCDAIHKELKQRFKFAFVSGSSVKFVRQRVNLNHTLKDGDVVELVLSR